MPPKSSGKKPYKDPLKVQNTNDPIKARVPEPKPYVDPLRGNPTTLKLQPVKYEYKPYNSFHEFKPSNIDPLTGRPYRQRKRKQESEEPEPEKEEQPIKAKPTPNPAAVFPRSLGSPVGSIKRTLYLIETK